MRRKQIFSLDMARMRDLYYKWEIIDPFIRWLDKKGYFIRCTCGMTGGLLGQSIHSTRCESYQDFIHLLTEFIESLPKRRRIQYGGRYETQPSKE